MKESKIKYATSLIHSDMFNIITNAPMIAYIKWNKEYPVIKMYRDETLVS